ncbi:DNA primase [Pseudonocardiaceae bacterium YIM PH 21723]|nr:DNA primase [Pseudonocardiaceae bacterium YIM PH 21723]
MAGRIRESDIAAIRDRVRIDEVISDHVTLGRAGGGSLKGLCPFHDEKSPSFNVRPSHGTFHCFGCGEGGDVIAFVQKIDHLSFQESVQRLADRIGLQLTYEGGDGKSVIQRDRGSKIRMLEAHKVAALFYQEQLVTNEAELGRKYLEERGFDQNAVATFGCGFAPSGWDRLTKHLIGRGFTVDELYKCGLSREGRQGPMDRFHKRLLWPIRDLSGDTVGFGARRIFEDDPIQAKYVNTSETPIYKKSQVLFGLDLAKREIAKRRQAVVVEGYTDVMAMHLAGVPTAVASCGTAFAADHISVLRRLLMDDASYRGEVIFTFDGDSAGQKAAMKAFEDDQKFATQTYIAIAPDGMDPCELRQAKGDAVVKDLVARRTPLFEFAIKSMLKQINLDTAEGRVDALRLAVPEVAKIKDISLRDDYARLLAGWVGWEDVSGVVKRVRQISMGGGEPAPKPRRQLVDPNQHALEVAVDGPAAPRRNDPRLLSQRQALKVALQYPAFAGPVYDSLPDEAFDNPAYLLVHKAILAAGGTASGLAGPGLVDAVSKRIQYQSMRSLVTELAVEGLPTRGEPDSRYVGSVLAGLQEALVGKQIADIKSKLQRVNPLEDRDEYYAIYGDLVAMEEYRTALRSQAMGAL